MDTKLTLRLDNNVIEKAKIYAKNHNISLSKMIETYLASVTSNKGSKEEITPLVESLSGVMELPADYDYKKERGDYIINKYQ